MQKKMIVSHPPPLVSMTSSQQVPRAKTVGEPGGKWLRPQVGQTDLCKGGKQTRGARIRPKCIDLFDRLTPLVLKA